LKVSDGGEGEIGSEVDLARGKGGIGSGGVAEVVVELRLVGH
jgi:hypothetical protein